ncbi:MAG: permease [Fibrobacterota bacterium]
MLHIFTDLADVILRMLPGIEKSTQLGEALHFFIEDTTKIFFLVVVMIYIIAVIRASLNMDVVRTHLQGRSRLFGYGVASVFGSITPFCSCSSIPMFLGFTSAGIPTGVTLSFLITSPLINEVAVVLLGALLGWKFTAVYIGTGLLVGIVGGFVFDALHADDYLQPMAAKARKEGSRMQHDHVGRKLTLKMRHDFAKQEVAEIFGRIWKWIIIGVGAGAALHGFVPESWIATHLGDGAWWSVPAAALMGIPLYSNATGMIPVVETLLAKGLPIGTALALMMSTVGASFPEFILLRQVLKVKLLVWLFFYFLAAFTVVGWIMNWVF